MSTRRSRCVGTATASDRNTKRIFAIGLLTVLCAAYASTGRSQSQTGETGTPCTANAPGEPMFVTESCVDPRFNDAYAYIDVDEVRDAPVPHRVVYGGFRGTDARFAFYFPPPEQYQGRFIQGPIHQLRLTSEVASREEIEFAFDSGAYLVETNNGGSDSCLTARDCLSGRYDPTIRGYRMNAAAAKFSKQMAERVYGRKHRPFGYLFGGSGGAYMTISSAEQTQGVWDGFMPLVFGHPLAIPDHYTVRINALRVLRARNKFPCIMDAIEPGGSGDPFTSCGLNTVEAQALREATRMGFPPRGWFSHAAMTGGALGLVAAYVPLLDPGYTADFWTKPGYLGTEASAAGASVRAARIQHSATIIAAAPQIPAPLSGTPAPPYDAMGPLYNYYIIAQYLVGMPPKALVLDSMPSSDRDLEGASIVIESGPGTGRSCPLMVIQREQRIVACGGNSDPEVIDSLGAGDRIRIDNSEYLALQTHHRHQVPKDRDYYGWNQFRRGGNGQPIYPQREVLVGPYGAIGASGSVSSGRFYGKMILVESMIDQDAFAWSADWYRRKVIANVGEDRLHETFRLHFVDHAVHGSSAADPNRTIGYRGLYQQALRDLFAWVERNRPAPASTNYVIAGLWDRDEAQVQLPASAAQRGGIQPVVHLKANGGVRADVPAGSTVTFDATIELPPGTGHIICAEFDFTGSGQFAPSLASQLPDALQADPGSPLHAVSSPAPAACDLQGEKVVLQRTYAYANPGTYFVALRATSQREGNRQTPFARVQNLGRVRVVVH